MESFGGFFVPAAQVDSKIMWKLIFGDPVGSFRFLFDLS